MPRESVVEIPRGSGNRYRYAYHDGATRYLGPVGSAPDLGEEEFMMLVAQALPQHVELANSLEKQLGTLEPRFSAVLGGFSEPMEIEVESKDGETTTVEGEYDLKNLHGRIRIDIEDYEGNRDLSIHVHEVDTEFHEDVVYETIEESFPMSTSTDEIVVKVMEIIREESSLV